eukprot:765826-Hanusia_phi.AAC.11
MEKLFTRPKAEMKSELVVRTLLSWSKLARLIRTGRRRSLVLLQPLSVADDGSQPQPDVKKKKGEVEEDVAVCAPGSVSLRSSIVSVEQEKAYFATALLTYLQLTKSAERQNALKWLA